MKALTGRWYAALEIQEGGQVCLELLRVTFGDVAEAERRRSAAPTISGVLWAA